jgi:D-alanine-D-alanine ligase
VVIFGGPSSEHDVSILTGLQAARVLLEAGEDVLAFYWTKIGEWFQVDAGLEAREFRQGIPQGARRLEFVAGPELGGFYEARGLGRRRRVDCDALVNCCHGGPGEDGRLQGAFDLTGIRYTGPTARGAALGMDKLAFAGLASVANLPTLPRVAVTDPPEKPPFPAPWIVKPRFGGSSIGISVVDDLNTLRALVATSVHLRNGAVVEPYQPNAVDLNVGVRSWPELELSAIERPMREEGGTIYSYADKYQGGQGFASAPRELPANIPAEIGSRLRDIARAVAELAQVRGAARIDFLWQGTQLWVNEINTIPGSLSLYLWRASGIAHAQLLRDLLAEAEKSATTGFVTEGADGSALIGVGNIAAKLR